jgi:hypothetical protein
VAVGTFFQVGVILAFAQPNSDLINILDSCSNVFTILNLSQCSQIVKEISTEISTAIPNPVNKNSIIQRYKNLQQISISEYSTNAYKNNIIKKFMDAVRITVSSNRTEMQHILNETNIVEVISQRISAHNALMALRRIIWNGAKTDEEKMIGMSYVYLAIVDGVYRNALRTCYVWEQLSRRDQVNTATITDVDVGKIQQYFTSNGLDLFYFEGWDRNIRNAVGHTTFQYDNTSQKTTYQDLRAQVIVHLSLDELIEMCDKLWAVYEITLINNQIWRVNDASFELCNRYT